MNLTFMNQTDLILKDSVRQLVEGQDYQTLFTFYLSSHTNLSTIEDFQYNSDMGYFMKRMVILRLIQKALVPIHCNWMEKK